VPQGWLAAVEEHSAYSTHYCAHEQGSGGEEDEEEAAKALGELTDSLQVAGKEIYKEKSIISVSDERAAVFWQK